MNTNNFLQGLRAGAKKIALAGLVFTTALAFTVIAMTGAERKAVASSIVYPCKVVNDFACGTNGEIESSSWEVYRCAHLTIPGGPGWVLERSGSCFSYQRCCIVGNEPTCIGINDKCGGDASTAPATSQITVGGGVSADKICGMGGVGCDPDKDKTCAWCGGIAGKPHAYCSNADNKWHVDSKIKDYCSVCGADEDACSCSIPPDTNATTAQTLTFGMGKYICGNQGTQTQNFSYSCNASGNYSTDTTGEGHGVLFTPEDTGCLNQECNTGSGKCEDVPSYTTKCDDMNKDVIKLMAYVKDGYIDSNGKRTRKEYKEEGDEKEKFIENFKIDYSEDLLQAAAAGQKKYYNGKTPKQDQIACSNEQQKFCGELSGGTYHFVCSSGWNGCRMWSWLTSGKVEKCPTGNCEISDGVEQGFCEITDPGEAEDTCNSGKTECDNDAQCAGECGEDFICNMESGSTDSDAKGYCMEGCRVDGQIYALNNDKCSDVIITDECGSNDDCVVDEGEVCVFDSLAAQKNGQGFCDTKACISPSNPSADGPGYFADGAVVCQGSSGDSKICDNPSSKTNYSWETNGSSCGEEGCDVETGECKNSKEGECKDISISTGNANETTSSCGGESCEGVCVPFSVTETGDCSGMTCIVTNDYDSGKATARRSGSKWYACMTPKSSISSSGNASQGSNPDIIHYTIKCTDSSGQTDTAEGSCPFPAGDDNPYSEKEEEANKEKAEEGEECSKDSDCQEGLVCEDGKCMSEEEAQDAGEGEDCSKDSDCRTGLICQDGTCVDEEDADKNLEAPTVTINSPSGTVTAKTAQLSVTTSLNAMCKYMDITEGGSFTASNFSGSGMTMSSSGYTHIATLNSLADTAANSSGCTKTHNVVVLCQNSEAGDQSNVSSIGSAQASFTVDLSSNSEYAPTVTSAMEKTEFTVANPTLKVTTNQQAECQYKQGSTFTYGSGTNFATTGNYSHNTELTGLASDDYDYYVVCRDADTCAAGEALTIKITVELEGGDSLMKITSTTSASQTVNNPTLSVVTDLPAACQYSTSSFTYGSGTQFTNDNDYIHTASLNSYDDGDYSFYVVCQEKESLKIKVLAMAIATTLARGDAGPAISNTTSVSQFTGAPTLSVTTRAAAKCQYSEDVNFTYGEGTQFAIDGETGHSVTLPDVADGSHTYYVLCKDVSSGEVNSSPVEIVFEVDNAADTCADIDSNDRESDEDRDYSDDDDSESKYAWRSVEDGERDEFTNVDWYAGYQFTPDEDGYVTQLCGYFADGESNEVTLYNGTYKELASTEVEGTDDWKCAAITPVEVKTDKRYYVIARVENGPIYYEYESDLLPADADNVVIESGIRQLAEDDFGEDIYKYDYMVFGLVDIKIIFNEESEEGPEIDIEGPDGIVDENYTTLSVETDEKASCKFSREDVDYSDMEYDFGMTGETTHEQKICKLDDGNFTFYVRCKNEDGDENDTSTILQFEVSD